jgi:hypothetical protein
VRYVAAELQVKANWSFGNDVFDPCVLRGAPTYSAATATASSPLLLASSWSLPTNSFPTMLLLLLLLLLLLTLSAGAGAAAASILPADSAASPV